LTALSDALTRLERAVARLEAVAREPRDPGDEQLAAAATEIAGRVDAALKTLDRLLEAETG
jgi:hypothetical protein